MDWHSHCTQRRLKRKKLPYRSFAARKFLYILRKILWKNTQLTRINLIKEFVFINCHVMKFENMVVLDKAYIKNFILLKKQNAMQNH